MTNVEIITYIRTERAQGVPDAVIRSNLATGGWNAADLDEAFKEASKSGQPAVKKYISPELKKYRNDRKWLIFIILMILPVFQTLALFGSPHNINNQSLVMAALIIGSAGIASLLGSSLVTSSLNPAKSSAGEFFSIVGRIILAAIVTVMIGGLIFFATCTLAAIGGMLRIEI